MSARDPLPTDAALAVLAPSARLLRLMALPRRPDEASFFFHESAFGRDAVKILPCEHFVSDDDLLLTTTLGSCVATCLWDREAKVGGMNHFMLPGGDIASGRYGGHAMALLIDLLLRRGATRATLEAKVFGGGQVLDGMASMNVGARNAEFALQHLAAERIPVVSQDLLGTQPRKVCFVAATGLAMVRRLARTTAGDAAASTY